jgi:Predicted nucleotide-binding protein containing TIR-like domain
VLDGKATIVLSHSVGFQEQIADPVARRLEQHGLRTVRVGEEPLPPHVDSDPNTKVEWFFLHADMAVFLATPDDKLESGEVHTRQNIIDEHRLGQQLPHIRHRLLVFKAEEVTLPSNINPVYEPLPLEDPDWIVEKIVAQARNWGVLPARVAGESDSITESSDEGTASAAIPAAGNGEATAESIAALNHAAKALGGAGRNRLLLRRAELSVAGLSAAAGDADTLGVHLANSLFAYRHEIHPRRDERQLLIRTYLRHSLEDNVPGIFWLKDLGRRQVVELLTAFAQDDGNVQVRAQALKMLGSLGAPSSVEEARRLISSSLASDDSNLRWAALDYVALRRDARLCDVLNDARLLERDRHRVSRTLALLDLPRRPSVVMERFVEDAYVRSPEVQTELLVAARRVRREAVIEALGSSVVEVRLLGIRMAGLKGMMSLGLALHIIELDRSSRVRVAAVRELIAGEERVDLALLDRAANKRDDDLPEVGIFDEERALSLEICLRLPQEDLRKGIRWRSMHGPACYEALGLRDERWAETHVRRDLRSDFAAQKTAGRDETLAFMAAEHKASTGRALTEQDQNIIVEAVEEHWKEWISDAKLGRFITRQFQRAGLRILVTHGRARDVEFAREFARSEDHDLRVEALRLFERFGTARDSATALMLVEQLYSDEHRQRAAELALRLAYKKDKLDVLATLRESRSVRTWAVEQLAEVEGGLDEASKLLDSDVAELRLAAAKVIWDAVDSERADGLLSIYMRGQHFYNVVRAIDRRLYAPDWLRDALAD